MGARARLVTVTALALVPLGGCGPASSDEAGSSAAPLVRTSSPPPTSSAVPAPASATATSTLGAATSTSTSSTTTTTSITSTTTTTSTSSTASTTTTSSITSLPAPTLPAPTFPAPAVRSGADASLDAGVGDPLAISIPEIGVESALLGTGTRADGSIDVPQDPSVAAWFTGGPRPGDRGPAVIVGHVDSKRGPGVFWRLHELPVGAVVTIQTTTGPIEFIVEGVEQYAKDQFPTADVYGSVPRPALRLITCGGSFDRSIGHYRDNIVAYLISVAH